MLLVTVLLPHTETVVDTWCFTISPETGGYFMHAQRGVYTRPPFRGLVMRLKPLPYYHNTWKIYSFKLSQLEATRTVVGGGGGGGRGISVSILYTYLFPDSSEYLHHFSVALHGASLH